MLHETPSTHPSRTSSLHPSIASPKKQHAQKVFLVPLRTHTSQVKSAYHSVRHYSQPMIPPQATLAMRTATATATTNHVSPFRREIHEVHVSRGAPSANRVRDAVRLLGLLIAENVLRLFHRAAVVLPSTKYTKTCKKEKKKQRCMSSSTPPVETKGFGDAHHLRHKKIQ